MMKAQSFLYLVACGTAVVISTVLFETKGYSQQAGVQKFDSFDSPVIYSSDPFSPPSRRIKQQRVVQLSQKLSQLRTELKNAKSTEQKAQTKKSVQEALFKYFDADMKQRRAELDRLTARSDKMSNALKKREAAKEQLVNLQLKSFQYEVDGLGLFSKQRTNSQQIPSFEPLYVYHQSGAGGTPITNRQDLLYEQPATDNSTTPLKAAMNKVDQARRIVRKAKSKEDRTVATTELRKALNQYFDVDLKARQQEMDTIKAGLEKMQAGLQKRADAKDDIVNLQLQIIVNEAEGLGFFRKSASRTLHGADNPIRIELGGFGTSTGYLFR